MEIPLLKEIIIILGLSSIVVLICQRFKIPSIIGFLITGALAGPHGFGLIHAAHEVEMIAEIGIVFLLFTIGIEFSFAHLLRIKRMVLQGGGLQVGLTIIAALGAALALGQNTPTGIFAGFLLALSSTAIVLKLFQERLEMDSPHGKAVLGVLILQDIVIVPMMLFTPLIAGKADNVGLALMILALKSIGVGVGVFFASKWLMPKLLYQVTKTRNNELFLLSIIATCLVVAWLTSSIGLSLSLGAFLAGLIISESEYSHQAMSNILPFRDIFISFFFVSVGMLLNGQFFLGNWPLILALTAGVIVLKLITGMLAIGSLGYPLRTVLLSGLALAQVGEFAFVLSRTGLEFGLLTPDSYQLFLAVSICTMVLTPLFIGMGPRTSDFVTRRLPTSKRMTSRLALEEEADEGHESLKDHLVIIGFGLNGKNLARAAQAGGIPYAIIETNPQTVQEYKARGERIFYGDATQPVILEHAHVKDARVAVIAISDPAATRRVTVALSKLNPKLFIIVRTRFVAEIEELQRLGASAVVPEEFETSIEIFSMVLQKYLVPQDDIERFTEEVRADGYQMLRGLAPHHHTRHDLQLADIEISSIRVQPGSPLIGKTLLESEFRQRYGVTLLAIRRPGETVSNPTVDTRFCENDVLVILGRPALLQDASQLCETPEELIS
jgi:CPA2 family monovalent cation:H+ antiporter-2